MSENDTHIWNVFAQIIPKLNEKEKDVFLSFCEGMVYMAKLFREEQDQASA